MDDQEMTRFEEIEVRRIRVVDEEGAVRMILTAPPLPRATFRGEPILEQEPPQAGLVFYNEEGTECGGLWFMGRSGPDGVTADAGLTFDQYEQDQCITISYQQEGSERSYGISMVDRPPIPLPEFLESYQR
ncbi:MAG: hypothetical protein ACRDI1_08215, partial [Actinomycetota bacterium]